jgi:Mn-dependent DtxR family transcriptional regulator
MSSSPEDQPLLIAVYHLFRNHRPRTLEDVVEELRVSESVAIAALERLEQSDVLVRARGGTGTPVWKRHPRSNERGFTLGGSTTL